MMSIDDGSNGRSGGYGFQAFNQNQIYMEDNYLSNMQSNEYSALQQVVGMRAAHPNEQQQMQLIQ
jgi:hypothetical protein